MPDHEEPMPTTKNRSRIVSVFVWLVLVMLVPMCGAWVIGRKMYWFDVVASEQMLISWVALAMALLVLTARRWVLGGLCVSLVCLSFYPVLVGRVWSLPDVDLDHKPVGVIRVITYNIHPENRYWEENMDQLLSYEADVMVLIEVNRDISRSIMRRDYLDSTPYPYWLHRAWVEHETSPGFILSRWAIEPLVTSEEPKITQNHLYARVEGPKGSFVVGLLHPFSPRTKSRWANGNWVTDSQRVAIKQIRDEYALPMLVCADLNAGPAQVRGDILRSTGLEMSKPVLRLNGSFPSNSDVPRLLRVQLDDVWSMGGIRPTAWSMINLNGSDHQAVVVDFVMED